MSNVKSKVGVVKDKSNTTPPSENNNSEAQSLGLEPLKIYTVFAIVSTKHFKEGKEMNVLGKLAEKMITNNQAKLKE